MNEHQKKVLRSWPSLLSNFVGREWISVFLSSGIGVLAAEVVHLVWRDEAFQYSLIFKYSPEWITFDDPLYYIPFLTVSFLLVLLAVGPLISMSFWRGVKSWLYGVTSGLVLLPFASCFSLSMLSAAISRHRLILGSGLVGFWFLLSAVLHINARVRAGRTILEDSNAKLRGGATMSW